MNPRSGTRSKTSLAAQSSAGAPLARYGSLLGAVAVVVFSALASLGPVDPLTRGALWLLVACVTAGSAWQEDRSLHVQPPGERFGQYTLHEKIGEGGMGVVFRATHALLHRPAAVKLLAAGHDSPESLERFEREAELTSRLSHPNTVAVYDFGRTESGTPFYAMEYLDGLDLETLVERHGPQDPRRVAHLLAQLAGALAEAHGIGLVHRDVKPANVMLCERGGAHDVVKVLDFGLTKELGATDLDASDGGRVVGTPLYLPPEAVVAPERVDARSDLYAVGAVGYFLLTGAPPFAGATIAEVCAHHLHTEPLAPSRRGFRVPRALEALILRCLAKSPDDRPESAAALRAELLELGATWTDADAQGCWTGHQGVASSPAPRVLHTSRGVEQAPTLLQALAG
jgi:eukaryotic-like serine/threonine-protein kinase